MFSSLIFSGCAAEKIEPINIEETQTTNVENTESISSKIIIGALKHVLLPEENEKSTLETVFQEDIENYNLTIKNLNKEFPLKDFKTNEDTIFTFSKAGSRESIDNLRIIEDFKTKNTIHIFLDTKKEEIEEVLMTNGLENLEYIILEEKETKDLLGVEKVPITVFVKKNKIELIRQGPYRYNHTFLREQNLVFN